MAALACGDLPAAARAASDACYADPNDAGSHLVYGQTLLGLNRSDQARAAFGAAVKLRPSWAEAWINFGVACYRQGAMGDAKLAMRQALLHAPDHPNALAHLKIFLSVSTDNAKEAVMRETLLREPHDIATRLKLAADLLEDERPEAAVALLCEETRPKDDLPSARQWHLHRSLALLQLGRPAEAQAVLEMLDRLGPIPRDQLPLVHWRRMLFLRTTGDSKAARHEANLMEATLSVESSDPVPEHEIIGHFDLGRFWSGEGESARAFRSWTKGHQLLARSEPFSRSEQARVIEDSIVLFDREFFASAPRAVNFDTAPVFIVGMPRSGTTLCEQILAAHRDVHGAGERKALAESFAFLAGRAGAAGIAALSGPALDTAAEDYLANLHALAPNKLRIVDKMPLNLLILFLVGRMLPGARIIHCTRDPRDIGLSIFSFRFYGTHAYAHDLADLGWMIGATTHLIERWKAVLPNPILTVKLADWVTNFDATLARVLDFLDLSDDPACARFYENENDVRTVSRSQVRLPVNSQGLGRWRGYATELQPLIEELDRAQVIDGWD